MKWNDFDSIGKRRINYVMAFENLPMPISDALSRRFYGNVEFYKEMVFLFVRTGCENINKIRLSIATNDWDTVQFLAHTLKGGASNVGAIEISSLAEELERLSVHPLPDSFDPLIEKLQQALHSFAQISQEL